MQISNGGSFYGSVTTKHEIQLAAQENQLQWYNGNGKYRMSWTVIYNYIAEGITVIGQETFRRIVNVKTENTIVCYRRSSDVLVSKLRRRYRAAMKNIGLRINRNREVKYGS